MICPAVDLPIEVEVPECYVISAEAASAIASLLLDAVEAEAQAAGAATEGQITEAQP